MLKKNTRKRLLAGALATVMMLTMCPSWALADDEDIAAPLPLVDENRPVAESAPVETDTTETPADPTPSAPEAKPAEGQDPAPAPSDGGANGGTDSTESGNSTNPTIPEVSENNSQNSDTVSNSPENEISMASLDIDLAWYQQKAAKYFILLPKRNKPENNADQNQENYLPSSNDPKKDIIGSDGGVEGLDASTGYKGFVTKEGMEALDDTQDRSITDIEHGVPAEYLDIPDDLGFFTPDNWNSDGTYKDEKNSNTDEDTRKALLDTENFKFHPNNRVEIVWYTIKDQSKYERNKYGIWHWVEDIHVDGYLRGVPINVTYHTNYKNNGITGMTEDSKVAPAKSGYKYTVESFDSTGLAYPDNYTFDGWYADGTKYNVGSQPFLTSDLDLYAKWVQDKFDVTYYVDGVKQDDATEEHAVGDNVTVRTAHPEKAGYTFKGWKTVDVTVENGKFTMPKQDVRFDAEFEINKHNVTYYVDGKKQDDATEEHAVGDNVTVSSKVPTKEGYTFKGWKTTDVNVKNGKFTMPENDVRFDAEFEKNKYTVTYYVDNEKYGAEQTYLYDDPVTLAAKPTRDGFNFNGWVPEGVALNATGTGFQMPAHNVVIRGTFDANSFYVAYYVDGILYASELYKTGAKVTIRGDLAKDGFTFSGWTRDNVKAENFDMPAHNVEIHGSYSQNTHKYTIKKHFYDEKGAEISKLASTANAFGAENAPIANLYKKDAVNQTDKDGKNYVYVSALTTVTPAGETLTKDVTIDLHYYLDVEGGEKPGEIGNGTPDAWEYRLTFKVVNGEWNNGGNADIVVYVQSKNNQTGEALENVWVPLTRIPFVGEKPNSGYHAGSWDTTLDGNTTVKKDTVFTYTYAKNSSGGSSGGSGGSGHHHRKPTVTIPDKVPTGLNGNDHYAYIVGYPDKTVRPQNGITRAEVATIFFRLLTDETRNANSTKSNSYSDVAAGAWYNHAVSTLSAMGIVKGDSNGKFNPNAPITRAEFAAIAARFDDKANSTTADFSDIVSHWAKNEISAASNNGWINGYPDGTFRPDNKITRAEAMTLVNRVLKRLPETAEDLHDDMIKWSDNSDASQWFYLAVQEATNSHYYKAKENKSEKWTELRDTRDWTELEK